MSIFGALNPLSYVEPVINAGNNLYKSIAGSKSDEDNQDAESRAAAQSEYAAEFASDKQGWFSNFMDGVNRIPRPMMTFYFFWLVFVLPIMNLSLFQKIMEAYTYVPAELWGIGSLIVTFYFGGREIQKSREHQQTMAKIAVTSVAKPWVDPDAVGPLDWVENKSIAAWRALKGK